MVPPEIKGATAAETRLDNPYYYLCPYMPTRFSVTEEEQTFRDIIWAFKDGRYSTNLVDFVAARLKDIVKLNFAGSPDVCLCVIPASTAAKTKARFNNFTAAAANAGGLKNGYSLIVNHQDREANHLLEGGGDSDIMKYVDIGDVKGKQIVLLDDVITRGRSYNKIAQALKDAGASKVVGLFIGKTTWKEE